MAIAEQLSVNRKTVMLWRQRFCQQRLDGLWEIAPGRGRKPSYDIDKIAAIVDATLQTKPYVKKSGSALKGHRVSAGGRALLPLKPLVSTK